MDENQAGAPLQESQRVFQDDLGGGSLRGDLGFSLRGFSEEPLRILIWDSLVNPLWVSLTNSLGGPFHD